MDYTSFGLLLLFSAVIAAICEMAKRMGMAKTVWGLRFTPAMPFVLGALGSLIPGAIPAGLPGVQLFYGLMAGALSGQSYNVIDKLFVAKTDQFTAKIQEQALAKAAKVSAIAATPPPAEEVQPIEVLAEPPADTTPKETDKTS